MLYTGALQKKVTNLSALSYNKALELCKEDRISEAISALRESLEYDKKNIDARNLLGLCYYRLGRIADALLQWTLSYKFKRDGNIAVDYMAGLESDKKTPDMYEAIELYNEALSLAVQGNTDMAVLSLKKALVKNKYLVDAMDLLALCYIETGKESEAFRLAEKAIAIDSTNAIALRYYRMLKPEKKLFFNSKPKDTKPRGSQRNVIGYFIGGVAAAAILICGLILPSIIHNYTDSYDKLLTDYNVLKNDMNSKLEDKTATVDRLTSENEDLRSRLYTADNQALQQRVRLLTDIKNYYDEGSIEEAADKLITLSTAGFSKEVLAQYSSLCKLVMPAAASHYFTLGKTAQQNGDNTKAREYLHKSIQCTNDGDEVRYSAMFQLGKIAQSEGDSTSAINYFKNVAEKHPIESIKNEAKKYVDAAAAAANK